MSEVKVKISVHWIFSEGSKVKESSFLSYSSLWWLSPFLGWWPYHSSLCFCCHTAFSNPNHPPPSLRTPCHYIGTTWIIENENLPISRSLNQQHVKSPFCHIRLHRFRNQYVDMLISASFRTLTIRAHTCGLIAWGRLTNSHA